MRREGRLPILSLPNYYAELNSNASTLIDAICSNNTLLARQSQSHNQLDGYSLLAQAIAQRPESEMLTLATLEYQYGLYALVTGFYRHAFMSLRLTMELALSGIFYSAQEIRYRRWVAGSADINWGSLIDNEEGLYSKNFIRAFSPEFEAHGAQYRAIAATAYRECSEFVHGNWKTHEQATAHVQLKEDLFHAWHGLADSAYLATTFAFAARFGRYLSDEALSSLQPMLTEAIGELPAVQALFGQGP